MLKGKTGYKCTVQHAHVKTHFDVRMLVSSCESLLDNFTHHPQPTLSDEPVSLLAMIVSCVETLIVQTARCKLQC